MINWGDIENIWIMDGNIIKLKGKVMNWRIIIQVDKIYIFNKIINYFFTKNDLLNLIFIIYNLYAHWNCKTIIININ